MYRYNYDKGFEILNVKEMSSGQNLRRWYSQPLPKLEEKKSSS